MKNVLVIGATGQIGRHTLSEALNAGHHVTAFGRSIERIEQKDENLQVFKGDVLNDDDLDKAMKGQDVVVLTFGAPLNKDTILHQPSLMEEGTRKVVQAMKKAHTPRLVCMSAIGAGDSVGHGRFVFRNIIEPLLLGRIMKDRTEQEKVVVNSALPEWTIIRPTELTDEDGAAIRAIEHLGQEKEPSTIARKDVGRFLADLIENKAYDAKKITITND